MISIPEKVEDIVNESPYLREALTDDIINLSGLARKIQPQIAKELMKPVSNEAVFMALQRYQKSLKPYYTVNPAEYLANLGLRSDLVELTVKNSHTLLAKLATFAQDAAEKQANVFVFTQGMYETTIITSSILEEDLKIKLKGESLGHKIEKLVGITLQRTHGQIETTGVLQYPLRILAWKEISVIEIITTLNDIMLIVREFEVDRAVMAIRQALQNVSEKPERSFDFAQDDTLSR